MKTPPRQGAWLRSLLALSSPLLILLALVALLQRRGSDRIQAVPSLLIGSGLLVTSVVVRRRRRRELLLALRHGEAPGAPYVERQEPRRQEAGHGDR